MDEIPTADHVAAALVAAAREVDPDSWAQTAIAAASGEPTMGTDYRASRTRNYAAKGLHTVFRCGAKRIGLMTGFGSPDTCISNIECQLRMGGARWWNPAALERVIAAILGANDAAAIRERAPVPAILPRPTVRLPAGDGAYVSADRPVPSKRVQSAREMLAEAVRNTAAMPIPD